LINRAAASAGASRFWPMGRPWVLWAGGRRVVFIAVKWLLRFVQPTRLFCSAVPPGAFRPPVAVLSRAEERGIRGAARQNGSSRPRVPPDGPATPPEGAGRGFPRGLKEPRQEAKRVFYFSSKNLLHFLRTLLDTDRNYSNLEFVFLMSVPLGRFYSSRPSMRSRREIVSE
jgi:hypothetical protein